MVYPVNQRKTTISPWVRNMVLNFDWKTLGFEYWCFHQRWLDCRLEVCRNLTIIVAKSVSWCTNHNSNYKFWDRGCKKLLTKIQVCWFLEFLENPSAPGISYVTTETRLVLLESSLPCSWDLVFRFMGFCLYKKNPL